MTLFAAVDTDEFLRTVFPEPDPNAWVPLAHQIAPEWEWFLWLMMGGRGTGKTDSSANWTNGHMQGPPCDPRVPGGHRMSIIAPTLGDAYESCVAGPSGLKAHNPEVRAVTRQGGTYVIWPNGAQARLFGAHTPDDVERMRAGGNRCAVWCEELAAWRQLAPVWHHMKYGLRLGKHPKIVASTTPKPRKFLINLAKDTRTAVTSAKTSDNPHLAQEVRDELYKDYAGTRLGRQELDGEMLTDIQGAITTIDALDEVRLWEHPKLSQRVCSIDPAHTNTENSDETGITVQGRTGDHVYLLADVSGRYDVDEWAMKAIETAIEWQCGIVLYEANQGSDANGVVLKAALAEYNKTRRTNQTVMVKPVSALLSKFDRALPLQQAIQQGRWHPVGSFPKLEGQLTTWTPGDDLEEEGVTDKKGKKDKSPDRMDSCVHGFRFLMRIGGKGRTSGRQIAAARLG